jgi:diguanylate cyclase (GGDEF)-like protein
VPNCARIASATGGRRSPRAEGDDLPGAARRPVSDHLARNYFAADFSDLDCIRRIIVKLRDAILWQPGARGRCAVLAAGLALILLLAYLHTLAGLTYEFYVFFALPVALVAWFLGPRAGYGVTIVTIALWFGADRLLDDFRAELLPMIFNSAGRLAVFCLGVRLTIQLHDVLDRERRLAREDVLTRLPNRRQFYERGRQALAQVQRDGAPITAAFIDLDKFKEVNDTAGHATGDALLVCVAEVLAARLRGSDIAGRLGGDEFALLLPGMGGATAKAYVEELRQRLLQAMSRHEWPVTFSIGVASYRRAPADFDVLLAEADGLMYEVKNGGRNRIMQRELGSPPQESS